MHRKGNNQQKQRSEESFDNIQDNVLKSKLLKKIHKR